jgi:hypothetical protein
VDFPAVIKRSTDMTRTLRYSERKRLAETGSLGPLVEEPSEALTNALTNLRQIGEGSSVGGPFSTALKNTCIQHFGWVPIQAQQINASLREMSAEAFLDYVEILAECGGATRQIPRMSARRTSCAISQAASKINDLFERHRFGYRLEDGQIRKIGSPVLDKEIVGPALLAAQRPGWEEVEKSFHEAIQHQRGGTDENDDALTSANAAVEAALKAAGFMGANLGPLTKDFKKSKYVPTELKGVPEALDALIGRSGALRSSHGDAHGKAAGAAPVPQALVDLAIHWAGAFIVYLSEAIPAQQ